MDHADTRLLARYALGEITDDAELSAFEEHLMSCEHCRRRALAIDLIGTGSAEGSHEVSLHIAAGADETPVAMCGSDGSRNIISRTLLAGLDLAVVCPKCLALLQAGSDQGSRRVN